MSIQITYFVHGTTSDNEQKLSSGWNDVALSTLGEQQAQELRNTLQGRHFDIVFCSDLQRAVRTAAIVFEDLTPIYEDSRLRECNYGKLNGQPSYIVEPAQERAVYEPLPGGESYEDVKLRIQDFLTMLRRDHDRKKVALVAHKAPQLALDVLLKGKTWKEAFEEDWRKTKAWQPGWEYELV
ncbi:MAG TPA: histidine phosphatase family protein [Candidatus Paceibacterota bacterium]|nr:histidine phosphatase family protein [Candidatus Paceibacterota bacterium]